LIIEYFGFAPNTVLQGKEATLSWKVTGVRRVFIEPEPGNVPAEGGHVFTPQQTATYRLTAYDASGKGYESSASVTVLPSLALNRFEVTPASVAPGQPVAITWDVRGARSVEILPRPGPSPSSGSAEDRPSVDTDYVLQAIDFSGRLNSFPAKHVSVVPPAAILSFGVARDSPVLRAGDVARLEWRTQNATYVELGQVGRAAADVSGLNSMSVPLPGAGTYSYQLSARGPAGGPTARQVVTLVVVPRLRSGSMVWQGNIGRSVREMVTVKGGSANFGRVISGEMPGFACTVDAVPPNVVILRTDPNCSWISIDVRGQGITRVELRWTERARP
jgi:hypothetical protein